MNKRILFNVLLAVLPALAAVLNALPNAVAMRFYPGGAGYVVRYFSGYALEPVGYGYWDPMLTGVLCGALAVVAVLRLFKTSEKLDKLALYFTTGAVVTSLFTMLGGTATIIGAVIHVLILCEALVLYLNRKIK